MKSHQHYDSALKSLFGDEAAAIIACIVPEAECLGELNVEIDRTTLKADLVYNIKRRGKLCVVTCYEGSQRVDADASH